MAPPKPQHVFLVEDIEVIRDNLVVALAEVSNAVVVATAEGEAEAIAWLTANPGAWDIAAIDLFLKQGSGLGVLPTCRNRSAHQRVVVLTNFATRSIRERCLKAGADHVFDKSTEVEAFLEYCAEKNEP
jgi:DNA-binding NarL/FixJ family response regulator